MGEIFANFEPYDVQATRREAREEGRKEAAETMTKILKELGIEKEGIKCKLKEEFGLEEEEMTLV